MVDSHCRPALKDLMVFEIFSGSGGIYRSARRTLIGLESRVGQVARVTCFPPCPCTVLPRSQEDESSPV